MDFEYTIENNEVTITNICDDNSSILIDIPEFIEGYPVTTIKQHLKYTHDKTKYINIPRSVNKIRPSMFFDRLTHINNIKLGDFTIIDDNFIYCESLIYVIKYQIGVDYVSENYYGNIRYFLEKYRYIENFR